MKVKFEKRLLAIALTIGFFGIAGTGIAQDKPADTMEIVKEKIRTDKNRVI